MRTNSPGQPARPGAATEVERTIAAIAPAFPGDSERAELCPGTAAAISGQKDRTVPDAVTHSTFSQHRHSTAATDLIRLAGQPIHDDVTGLHRRPARHGKAGCLHRLPRNTPATFAAASPS